MIYYMGYNKLESNKEALLMKRITTIVKPCLNRDDKTMGCGECQASCQSACKTSCTVANQSCENK